jgi:hypothetical protein
MVSPREALDRANAICDEIERDRATRDPFAPDVFAKWQETMPERSAPTRPAFAPERQAMAMHPDAQKGWDNWFTAKAKAREKIILESVGTALAQATRDATEAHIRTMRDMSERFTTTIGRLEARVEELEAEAVERESKSDLARSLRSTRRLNS